MVRHCNEDTAKKKEQESGTRTAVWVVKDLYDFAENEEND